jgi:hypothetical protein
MISAICWLYRRTNEPPPTDVQCYWRKSLLSEIRTKGLVLKINEMKGSGKFKKQGVVPDPTLFTKWLANADNVNCQLTKHFGTPEPTDQLDIQNIVFDFKKIQRNQTFENFVKFASNILEPTLLKNAEIKTKNQSTSNLWHKLRYGRVTASVFYQISRCTKSDGNSVEQIMGGKKFKPTKMMKRGIEIEDEVFQELKKIHPNIEKCGLYLSKEYPLFGASPDGIDENSVYEIKCPAANENIKKYYVSKNEQLHDKVKAQINLQMLLTGRKKGVLVIADQNFEQNRKISTHEVKFDNSYTNNLVEKCTKFYKENIFEKVLNK